MKFELSVLRLESNVQKQREELTNEFLLNSGIDPNLCTLNDKMSVYNMLVTKAEKYKQTYLDKLQ